MNESSEQGTGVAVRCSLAGQGSGGLEEGGGVEETEFFGGLEAGTGLGRGFGHLIVATDEGLGKLLLERFPYAKVRHFLWAMAQDGARLEAASGRQLNGASGRQLNGAFSCELNRAVSYELKGAISCELNGAFSWQLNTVISWDDYGSPRYSMMRRACRTVRFFFFL